MPSEALTLRRCLGRLLLFELWVLVFACHMAVYAGDRVAWFLLGRERKSRYVRRGSCARTGQCCQALGIELPESWVRRPRVVAFFQRWYALVHHFQPIGPPQGRLLPLSCGYLREGHVCGVYPFRPKLCREYPQVSLFGKVELHRGCGFWFVERAKLGTFEERLLREQHEAERREFLRVGEG
ncbi:MAG: YkgJ family cysteine cluster protein [Deltaproteobacteria bacterium]|nr:YkgJ family cysteine cluster protein [Deltaproteobacteria bacterium]